MERATGTSAEQKRTEPLPELDLSAFILALATIALVGLGFMPNPQTNQSERNLPAAKQLIDILGLLKDKTKGNLSQDEQELLDSVLSNLRMQYVRAMEGKKIKRRAASPADALFFLSRLFFGDLLGPAFFPTRHRSSPPCAYIFHQQPVMTWYLF